MMTDKQYLSETIVNFVLKKLDELKQIDQPLNMDMLQTLVEQAQKQG